MAIDRAFDFGGINILAAGDDHVLHPVMDEEIAVLVEITRIAGMDPAVLGQRAGGRIGQVPIAQHIVRRPGDNFAHLAQRTSLPSPSMTRTSTPGSGLPAERMRVFPSGS